MNYFFHSEAKEEFLEAEHRIIGKIEWNDL